MKNSLFVFFIVVVMCSTSTLVYAYELIDNTYGINTPPLYFTLYSGFENSTVTAIHNACVTWNNGGVGPLIYRGTSGTHNYIPTSFNDFYVEDDTNRIMKGELGTDTDYLAKAAVFKTRVSIIPLKYKIVECDIVYNVSYDLGNGDLYNVYDIESITLHEFGHAIGLKDLSSDSDSYKVMYESRDIRRICRELSQDEKNALEYLY